jgi:lysozyme family protein
MRENFERALKFVLAHENVYKPGHYGDYAFVIPEKVGGDAGGLTKWGIDARDHPGIDINALDYNQARSIYFDGYHLRSAWYGGEWHKCRCDELPTVLDIAVFNFAVNPGVGATGIFLQRALNALASAGLTVDGRIGPRTLGAVALVRTAPLIQAMLSQASHYYRELAEEHPRQSKFLHGWLDRVGDLGRFLLA